MNCATKICRGAAAAARVRRHLLSKLTHVDPVMSTPQMVDVSAKESTVRYAHAQVRLTLPRIGRIYHMWCLSDVWCLKAPRIISQAIVLLPAILTRMLTSKQSNDPDYNKGDDSTRSEIHTVKGPVFTTAIIAGVMAAKRTPDLIPLCHSLSLGKLS